MPSFVPIEGPPSRQPGDARVLRMDDVGNAIAPVVLAILSGQVGGLLGSTCSAMQWRG